MDFGTNHRGKIIPGNHRPTPRIARALAYELRENRRKGPSEKDLEIAQKEINRYRDSRDAGNTPSNFHTILGAVEEARDIVQDNLAEDRYQAAYGDAGRSPRDDWGDDDGKRDYLFDHPEGD